MRKVSMVVVLAVILLSAACGREPNDAGLYGNVERVREYVAELSFEDGKEQIGEKVMRSETIFDERGREVELKEFEANEELARRTVSEYIEFDDPVKQTTFDPSGEITWEAETTLNANGIPVVVTWHDFIGDETYRRVFNLSPDGARILSSRVETVPGGKPAGESEYDGSNRAIKSVLILGNGWTWEITNEWGTRVFLIKKVTVTKDESGQLMNKVLDIHDGKGNILSREIFNPEGKLEYRETFSYRAFDQQGNWTERVMRHEIGEGNAGELTSREITYRR